MKSDGHISLIDFGIMRTYKPNNLADTVCLGTAGFAAPEQFGGAQKDYISDICTWKDNVQLVCRNETGEKQKPYL